MKPISIHVPAWGTTISKLTKDSILDISIHVPAWGTTGLPARPAIKGPDFNPRSRVGNDMGCPGDQDETINFNPRSRVGNDRSMNTVFITL